MTICVTGCTCAIVRVCVRVCLCCAATLANGIFFRQFKHSSAKQTGYRAEVE